MLYRCLALLLCLSTLLTADTNPSSPSSSNFNPSSSAVSYSFASAGRFGDRMLTYLHAKWVSHLYHMPLLYRPFLYSSRFALDDLEETRWSQKLIDSFEQIIHYKQWDHLSNHNDGRYLYIIPYFPECLIDLRTPARRRLYFKVQWEDPAFKAEVRRLLTPKQPTKTLTLPSDAITVALHIRRGGNFDTGRTQRHYPLKFAPHRYYADQVRYISQIFDHKPLYVHIFTDDLQPYRMVEHYRRVLADMPNVTIACHTPTQQRTFDLIDDLFAMTQFDCLVRPESHFSLLAAKLTDYQLEISPTSYHRNHLGQVSISQVHVVNKRYLYSKRFLYSTPVPKPLPQPI